MLKKLFPPKWKREMRKRKKERNTKATKKNRKDNNFTFRCSDNERSMIKDVAVHLGMSESRAIIALVRCAWLWGGAQETGDAAQYYERNQ